MSSDFYKKRMITTYDDGVWGHREARLVSEHSLAVMLNGEHIVTMACSPHALAELALGYLVSEGIMKHRDSITSIQVAGSQVLIEAENIDLPERQQGYPLLNSCNGISFNQFSPTGSTAVREPERRFKARDLLALIRQLEETSKTFELTGGVHSAGLGNHGQLLYRYEDIGRHNAVDKVLGHAWLQGFTMKEQCLVLSGRIAAEIVFKAHRHGVSLVLSRSAPSLKAVEWAEHWGMTVVGFARGTGFNVYTGTADWNED